MVSLVACFSLSLLILSASTCFLSFVAAQHDHLCLPNQAAALLELRRGFSSFNFSRPWQAGTDCCMWEGVTCNATSGMVTELNLIAEYSPFSGSIDASLARLPSLSVLQLDGNNLFSSVLNFLGELSSLTLLSLNGCDLRGQLQDSLFRLPSLQMLSVSGSPKLSWSSPEFPEGSALESLDLSGSNFFDILPESLGNLKSLTMLDLSNCSLFGSIPSSIRSLTRLVRLDLSSNHFQGQIPRSVFEFQGLDFLSLAGNNFNNTKDLNFMKRLSNLTYLDLSNIPLSMRLDDSAHDSALSFPSINILILESCNLSNIPTFLRYQKMMGVLDLSNNKIGGAIPEWVWSIGAMNLNYLNLSSNLFTHLEGTASYLPQSSIVFLDLHSNQLRGQLPIPPPNIILLDYSNNYFSSSIPSNLGSYLNDTIFFSLSNNSLGGKIPSSMCNAIALEVIDLSYNNLSGYLPQCLFRGGDNYLSILNLRGNRFRGRLPQNISQGCMLRTLNLNGNDLRGRVPKSLAHCESLQVLDLGNNQIRDIFPSWLENISTLRVLILKSNQFYGHVNPPKSYEAFSLLQIFDLSLNKFDGPLPSKFFGHLKAMMVNVELPGSTLGNIYVQSYQISTIDTFYQDTVSITSKGLEIRLQKILTTLISIDLSNNLFEGGIPEVIGDMKLLYMLNLSRNTLTGGVPPVLGTLSQLEALDLSRNQLSGKIPPELTSLTFLSYLDLSYNNLNGVVPTGAQFSTFSNSSFEGNEGLCGSPMSKKCFSPNVEPHALEFNNTSSKLDKDLIWLYMFVGLGFGIGFAIGISLPLLCTKGRRRRKDVRCLNFVHACY